MEPPATLTTPAHPRAPTPDRGRTPQRAVVDENVQFTVYRPNAVQPKVWYPLLAFAHLAERRPDAPPGQPDPLEQVQELAAQALGDEAAYGAPRVDARGGVPREGQLTFAPFVEGVDFNPRSQTFEWQEDVHQQNFRLKARPDTAGRVLRGQLTVYLGAFILADIDLTFRVDLAAPSPPTPTVRGAPLSTSSASQTSPQPELTPATAAPTKTSSRPTATRTWLSSGRLRFTGGRSATSTCGIAWPCVRAKSGRCACSSSSTRPTSSSSSGPPIQ